MPIIESQIRELSKVPGMSVHGRQKRASEGEKRGGLSAAARGAISIIDYTLRGAVEACLPDGKLPGDW